MRPAGWMLGFGAVAASLGLLGLLVAACSSPSGPSASSGAADASVEATLSSPGTDVDAGSSDASAPAPQALVRIANTSPDAPPLDVCVALHGTAIYQGPLLGQLAAGGDESDAGDAGTGTNGATPGVAYPQVSAYLALAPGRYDVRIVAAGAPSCDSRLTTRAPAPGTNEGGVDAAGETDASDAEDSRVAEDDGAAEDGGAAIDSGPDASSAIPDQTNLPSLAGNTSTTLLVAGDLSPAGDDAPLTVTMLADDEVLSGGAVALRAINAVPSQPSLDFGLGSGSGWERLLTDVTFAAASRQTGANQDGVDANGYTPVAPLSSQAMSARPSSSDAGADTALATSVKIDLGSIATVIAVGGKTGDSSHPPALLLCIDNQPSGGLLSDCSVAQ